MADEQLTDTRKQQLIYLGILVFTVIGLAASMALLVDYLRPAPLYCSETAGCFQLRQTRVAHLAGVPLPAVGVAGYLLLGVLALLRGPTVRFVHLMATSFAACAAGYLIYVQVSLSTYCAYCLAVDLSSILLVGFVLGRVHEEIDGFEGVRNSILVSLVFVVALAGPIVPSVLIKPKLPELISREIGKTPHGQVTIVDFIDFECPYCRQTAADLAPALAKYPGKYRLVRKQTPLVRAHPHALAAAHASCCAESMGKGDAMADRLIAAPITDLTDEGCTQMATEVGLDENAFRVCIEDPSTQKIIDSDLADFKAVGGHALPTIWIQRQKIEGAEGPETLLKAMEKAIEEVGG